MRRQSWAGPMGLSLDRQLGLPGATPGMMMVPYATLPTPGIPTAPTPAALRLRGLPGDATNADVAQFLSGQTLTKPNLLMSRSNMPHVLPCDSVSSLVCNVLKVREVYKEG